ncbi:cation efflux family-domain-containing protein [Podospora australis]|uniref:Zinc transporter n=1 Tax=Podospora australis TaxID=1536484 RepID=A0AAN6X3W4_9PEZI|nr:cation efflux family-domain-containing protein [Podospora australis]
MASKGPPLYQPPPGTPPTPVFTTTTGPGEPSSSAFRFVCDDFDQDRDQENNSNNYNTTTESDIDPATASFADSNHFLAPSPRSSPAAFYHNEPSGGSRRSSSSSSSLLLRPPSAGRISNMVASEDGLANGNGGDAPAAKNPFNFQTQIYTAGPVKSNIGQRRGHRYKHSSISATHQFFQEPPPRPPPVLPASLPIPTLREAWTSMQRDQRARLWWCCCHAAVALYVFFSAEGSLAMTALSHLVFFDVGSAAVCVAVDVLGNFEVWRRSSIRHPFGLQRAEVLAGFAMSVFLLFGGFDLISHSLKDVLESVGHSGHTHHTEATGTAHTGHSHGGGTRYIKPGTLDLASLAAVISTLVSAYGLRNHGRIRRVMRVPLPYLKNLLPGAGILANPFHFLTLCFAFVMLILPLVYIPHIVWLDRLICAAIAGSMFVLGFRLAVAQGLMLLMSYSDAAFSPSPSASSIPSANSLLSEKKTDGGAPTPRTSGNTGVSAVVREIESEPQVARVEEAQFWQVHYGLAMANLKVCLVKGVRGDDSTISQLRSRLARVVQNRLGEGYGRGGSLRWEVTVQMSTEGK